MQPTRRRFLGSAVGASAVLGMEGLGFLARLRPVSANEARVAPELVRLDDSIEPVVRLLEETPREKLIETVAAKVRAGMSYRELLAGLLLAGVRNVQPRPNVGFKFHAVLVVNSAHLASLASADSDRWLPIFWALDNFKSAQAATVKESGWRMKPVNEPQVPRPSKVAESFSRGMDEWDEDGADAAAAGIARFLGMNEAFALFSKFGPRDFRDIGHKAIYVSNSFRTLQCIGWQHAETVLRSLAYALLKNDGTNPASADLEPDRPWKHNADLAGKIGHAWQEGKADDAATKDLISTLRTSSESDAAAQVVELLNRGVSPRSVWDGLLCGAGELLMRNPGIVSLHSVTSANALRYAYDASADERHRLQMLLQTASFVTLFRQASMSRGGKKGGINVDEFAATSPKANADGAVSEIFEDAGGDRMTAASKTLAFLRGGASHEDRAKVDLAEGERGHADAASRSARAEEFMRHARRLVFLKGNDSHDYKFSSAVLEDYYRLSPAWRDRYLASSLFYLPSAKAKDTTLVRRIRDALG